MSETQRRDYRKDTSQTQPKPTKEGVPVDHPTDNPAADPNFDPNKPPPDDPATEPAERVRPVIPQDDSGESGGAGEAA